MNRLAKIVFIFITLLLIIYNLYFYISPSVTVVNKSGEYFIESNVSLPNSNLDFGFILTGQRNIIHYALSQNDGSYFYSFKLSSIVLTGSCGYITNSEINKRVVIIINEHKQVVCKS